MKIRKSRCEDISEIMNIISIAKEYMIAHGNPTQWGADYPGEEVLKSDIMNNNSYVIRIIIKKNRRFARDNFFIFRRYIVGTYGISIICVFIQQKIHNIHYFLGNNFLI